LAGALISWWLFLRTIKRIQQRSDQVFWSKSQEVRSMGKSLELRGNIYFLEPQVRFPLSMSLCLSVCAVSVLPFDACTSLRWTGCMHKGCRNCPVISFCLCSRPVLFFLPRFKDSIWSCAWETYKTAWK
jgi:hypothetical protein